MIVLAGSGGGDKAAPSPTAAATHVTSLAGIPQSGVYLGNHRAPLTVAYYSDLQCPACRDFQMSVSFQALLARVRRGEIRLVYRAVQTATRDRGIFEAQQTAALAAGQQNRLWDYIERFYAEQGTENSGYVTDGFLTTIARQTPGLNLGTWQQARHAPALITHLTSDARAAIAAGINGTPTLRQIS
jgi:protein-disulfide isomerase